jgi:conjugative relaxase-like TrwC/TraI family protein
MISKFEISSSGGAASYFDSAFSKDNAQSADNYYLSERAEARWEGAGAELLGIKGQHVEKADFVQMLEGKVKNPDTGELQDLSKNTLGSNRRLGIDFTISPPKSVSVVGLVGNDERILSAHQKANRSAMTWLQEHGSIVRVKGESGENVYQRVGNLTWASVSHEVSRANEPQIHNHNVVLAIAYDESSQKWRSLTNDQLYQLRTDADVIYKAALAKELKTLGYELETKSNGIDFEIKGISEKQLETFSTRSAQLDDALRAKGINPDEATHAQRQAAALESRDRKAELPREVLQERWKEMAISAGMNLEGLVSASKERGSTHEHDALRVAQSVGLAITHMAERDQAFSVASAEIAAVKFAGQPLDSVKAAIETHIKNGSLIDRGVNQEGVQMLTTSAGLDAEHRFLESIRSGFGTGDKVLKSKSEFDAALKDYEKRKSAEVGEEYRLSPEQVNAAANVLMHQDRYQAIQGDAGTGKTAALAFVKEVAESRGWTVMGIATTGFAAGELEKASQIKSETVASYLQRQENEITSKRLQISELRQAIQEKADLRGHNLARVERAELSVKVGGADFGTNRYTIDNQKGEVFKSANNISNLIGNWFTDWAESRRESATQAMTGAETLRDRLQTRFSYEKVRLADNLGKRMTTYEQVGVLEAVGAKEALYRSRPDPVGGLKADLSKAEAELKNLERTGNKEGRRTLIISDESSLMGVKDSAKVAALADAIGARVVLQGDTKQHNSVAAGLAFKQAQQIGMSTSKLTETRRFRNATPQQKEALEDMKLGSYGKALSKLDMTVATQSTFAEVVADRFMANHKELLAKEGRDLGSVSVVTNINSDRKEINLEIQRKLRAEGLLTGAVFTKTHLEDPKATAAQSVHVGQLRELHANALVYYKAQKDSGIKKHEIVRIERFDADANLMHVKTESGRRLAIDPSKQDGFRPMILETRDYMVGIRVEARDNITQRAAGGQPGFRVKNATTGIVTSLTDKGASVKWSDGQVTALDNLQLRRVDISYARTTFKEQGATRERVVMAFSDKGASVFNKLSAYVAATRAKDNTEIVTTAPGKLYKNADRTKENTTAMREEETAKFKGKDSRPNEEKIWDGLIEAASKNKLNQETKEIAPTHQPGETKDQSRHKQDRGNDLSM